MLIDGVWGYHGVVN